MSEIVGSNLPIYETLKSKRRANDIGVTPHTTALFDKSLIGMAPKVYNHIPNTIRNVDNLQDFKNQLHK